MTDELAFACLLEWAQQDRNRGFDIGVRVGCNVRMYIMGIGQFVWSHSCRGTSLSDAASAALAKATEAGHP